VKLFRMASNKAKLKFNKLDWIRIGEKAGWLKKQAESYNNGRMVFTEGESFSTPSWGRVTINSIDVDTALMTVTKENGEAAIVDMDEIKEVKNVEEPMRAKRERQETLEREQEERRRVREERIERTRARDSLMSKRFTGLESFFLMGFIANNGTISAQVPSDKVDSFEREYRGVKGMDPLRGSYEIADASSKWFRQYRIHLPKNKVDATVTGIMIALGFEPKTTSVNSNVDLNESRYVLRLFELGFDIGKNNSEQTIDIIEDNIRQAHGDDAADSFLEGVLY